MVVAKHECNAPGGLLRFDFWSALYLLPFAIFFQSAGALPIYPGTFETFDMYDEPVGREDSPKVRAAEQHLAQARKGGQLRLATTSDMFLIWPVWFKDGRQQSIMPNPYLIYESLMEADPLASKRTVHAHLLESLTIERDLKTVIFNLRPGVKFSDGSSLTAQDIIETFKFGRDVAYGANWDNFYGRFVGHPEFRVIDPLHLEVKFVDVPPEKLRTALFNIFAMPIVKKSPQPSSLGLPMEYIGTGPYAVTEAKISSVTLTRRPEYWASARPYHNFDSIKIEQFRTVAVAREAIHSRTINFWRESQYWPAMALRAASEKSFFMSTDVNLLGYINTNYVTRVLAMNMDHPMLNSLALRKAIALAYDSENALYSFFGNRFTSVPAPGVASEFRPGGVPEPKVLKLMDDPNLASEFAIPFEKNGLMETTQFTVQRERLRRAISILREAGFVTRDTWLEKDGKRVVLKALLSPDDSALRPLLLLQKNLRFLGIQLDLQNASDDSVFEKSFRMGQFDLIPAQITWPRLYKEINAEGLEYALGSYNAVSDYGKSGAGSNPSNLRSPAVDKILSEMQEMVPGTPEYRDYNEALIRLISAAVPFVPIGEPDAQTIFHDRDICVPNYVGISIIAAYYCR